MPGLDGDIEAIASEIGRIDGDLAAELASIDREAAERRTACLHAASRQLLGLQYELARLRLLKEMLGSASLQARTTVAPAAGGIGTGKRKPAPWIVLELLKGTDQPVAAEAIDRAVVAAGWTGSAARKARTRLRASGAIDQTELGYVIVARVRAGPDGMEEKG